MFAFIVGSGFSETKDFQKETVETEYGVAEVYRGKIQDVECLILLRHGDNHEHLPHHINFLANMSALKKLGATKIVSFTVVGLLEKAEPLAKIVLPTDVHFVDNRLPNGSICSFFRTSGKERGHLICESHIHSELRADIASLFPNAKNEATYVHSFGPRFNSKSEIRQFQSFGGTIVSQTCGPEAILVNELELPFALVTFPTDYANGVSETPTSMEELTENMSKSQGEFWRIIEHRVQQKKEYAFEGFVYRF